MDNKYNKLVIGALLHDIGKVLYRYNFSIKHSESGYQFLKENKITDVEILNQVRFHHSDSIRNSKIPKDDLAYLTYWADNVASGADRRDSEYSDDTMVPYDKYIALESIFNNLNMNSQKYKYNMSLIYDNGEIEYPKNQVGKYAESIYGRIVSKIKEGLSSIELTKPYINSLLSILEANLTFVPSSTNTKQICDISLFDHSKITAAVAGCIYYYCMENGINDYQQKFYKEANKSYADKMFIMYSVDMSGIQDFIYDIASENALKMLRAKSFYIEILLENIIGELFDRLSLSRANLIYSGGGHAYILLPNTDETKTKIKDFHKELNEWFLKNFQNDLYLAHGYTECSANELMNSEKDSYSKIFKRISEKLSENKSKKYNADEIRILNNTTSNQYERECKLCRRTNNLNEEDTCNICESFKQMATNILEKPFVVILDKEEIDNKKGVILPFGKYMFFDHNNSLPEKYMNDTTYIRSYSKNKMYTGKNLESKIWYADYSSSSSFEELSEKAKGIKRLGVLRADVDNLGKAFMMGFERGENQKQISSLSRNATFSRKMSMFFKLHLNYILQNPKYSLDGREIDERNATIIYSGGDDLFIIGAWNDVIELAVDINNSFRKYCQETLSISGGIAVVHNKYPVKSMAETAGRLEEISKAYFDEKSEKNSITIFEDEHNYSWNDFTDCIIGEKFKLINKYFSTAEDKGNSAIYNLLNYIRNSEHQINLARLAYMLGRMEPDKKASDEEKANYNEFARKLYKWIKNEKDTKELITAIYIYVYLNRGRK